MISVSRLKVIPTSLVSKEGLQRIVLQYECSATAHLFLSVKKDNRTVVERCPVSFSGGKGETYVMLPVQEETFEAQWCLWDQKGAALIQADSLWQKPREWTLYVMISSHTDIGLHNSQYIQRKNSALFLDQAAALCDATEENDPLDRYRYTAEGTWFWNNYGEERGKEAAERLVKDYVKTGKIGVCAGVAGNHIQTFGPEELCRSTYEKRRLKEGYGVESETLSMIDNNGLPWSMIAPFSDAGYRNLIFSPNHWNPLRSTVWKADLAKPRYIWNTAAGGGGARIDVRPESHLPMVFNWESPEGKKLTVWCCSHYADGFGFFSAPTRRPFPTKDPSLILAELEDKMWQSLALLEEKFSFDIWLTSSYWDDQEPDTYVLDQIKSWNAKWKYPCVRTLGNPDEPFRLLRERFGDRIPTLRGDITGGWYQHPLSVPELMAEKFEADRALPRAEKWSTAAALVDKAYSYPATDFRRAWDHLLFNDEHSYGTSGYKGRSVYETWMQHRDWIEKARTTAEQEERRALEAISTHVEAKEESLLLFNSTGLTRKEEILTEEGNGTLSVTVPPFGYRAVPKSKLQPVTAESKSLDAPPTVENGFYRIRFGENGAICSLYDKELKRELVDPAEAANRILYTKDNHQSFSSPQKAVFTLCRKGGRITVEARTEFPEIGGTVTQRVTLLPHEKRIDVENRISPAKDLAGNKRYDRYLYYAFPFLVENSRRLCHLNGAVAEYAKDITGHGTDVYMACCEWCCAENEDFGVALMMKDTHVVEFDRIHPDKTDFGDTGERSHLYVYCANDWLQKQVAGGSHLHLTFRFAITSYKGDHRSAGIPQMAECYLDPLKQISIPPQTGTLPSDHHCLLPFETDLRFLCLKRADDGEGVIARFYGEGGHVRFDPSLKAEENTVDERPAQGDQKGPFFTYRLGKEKIRIREKKMTAPAFASTEPLPIGSVYTGLITEPCAAAGENRGHLYLLWGASREEGFSHYRLYRSEEAGFEPTEDTFLCAVPPEDFVVGRYEDTGLKDHTPYFYRVCAVNRDGVCGPMSKEFSAFTRELRQGEK